MNNFFILETKNLKKRFGKEIAVDSVNLQIPENCVYGLLGPNGAGKSTILKLITGIIKKTEGEIYFGGKEWERNALKDIGALIENPPLYENLTARENLKVRALMLNIEDKRIDEVLEMVKLTDTGNKKCGQFSLGMKQRLGIALALLNNPKLLILDEPTNGLDPFGILELRNLIRSFPQKGITVIVSSHILSEIEQMADNIGILCNGKLMYQAEIKKEDNLENLFIDVCSRASA